jgi:hypothetical protein
MGYSKCGLTLLFLGIMVLIVLPAPAPAQQAEPPTAELPVIVVAPGLTPEIEMVRILAGRAKVEVATEASAKPEDLAKDGEKVYNSMILVIGGSGKGLGAAGASIEDEMKRAEALIARGKELGIFLMGVHLGGEARRGPNTEKIIPIIVPNVDYVVVRKDGNKDGIFTELTADKKIPLTEIEKTTAFIDVLKAVFPASN